MATTTIPVAASGADGDTIGGTFDATRANFKFGGDGYGTSGGAWLRFVVTGPAQGVLINDAFVRVYGNFTNNGLASTNAVLYANDVDAAAAPTTTADLNGRALTTASTAITVVGAAFGVARTIDVTAILQEIVDRAGWVSGNGVCFISPVATNTQDNQWQTFDGASSEPELVITYGESPTAPVSDAGPDQSGLAFGAAATLDATGTTGSPAPTGAWTKVSGPGTLTFGSSTSPTSTVTSDEGGAHVLRWTATNSEGSDTDDVSITWDSPPSIVTYSASGALSYPTANMAVAYPSGLTNKHYLLICAGTKPETATSTNPSGWTHLGSKVSTNAASTGVDVGKTIVEVWGKEADGTESGTQAIVNANNNVSWCQMHSFIVDTGSFDVAAVFGEDATGAGNWSAAMASNPGLVADDLVFVASVIPTDVSTPSQFSAEAVTATGATFSGMVEVSEPDSSGGNDIGGFQFYQRVATGPASAAPTVTATVGGTTTNVYGPTALIRLRKVSSGTPATVAAVVATATAAAPAPVVSAAASLVTPTATATASAPAPVITVPAAVAAVTATAAADAAAPVVTAAASVVTPTAIASADAPAPVVTVPADLAAPTATATAEASAPTVTGAVVLAAVVASATGDAYAPVLEAGAVLEAPVATASGDAPVPAVEGGASIPAEVAAPVAEATGEAPAPTVGGEAVVTALVAEATGEAHVPTVTGLAVVASPTATATGEAHAPTLTAGAVVEAPPATATGDAPAPQVTAGSEIPGNVSAPVATATGEAPAPVVVVPGTVTSVTATAVGDARAPVLSAAAMVEAPVATAIGEAVAPSVYGEAAVVAFVATASGDAHPPVLTGAVDVRAPPAEALGEAPAPVVVGGADYSGLPTAERTIVVPFEARLLVVAFEDRTLVVPSSTVVTVPAEDRTIVVPFDPRTITV